MGQVDMTGLRIAGAIALIALVWAIWPSDRAAITAEATGHEPGEVPLAGVPVRLEDLHIVTSPGLYGLGPDLPGSRYGVVAGHLIRFDPQTHRTLSVLRRESRLMD